MVKSVIGGEARYKSSISKYEMLLYVFIIAYVIILSIATSLKYYCFRTLAFDFGIFVQIFWHSIHGNYMFTQPRGSIFDPTSFMGVHFSPLLMLLIPVYGLIQSPYFLLIIQTIALASPAYFIYKIGIKVTGKEKLSLIFGVGYLLYPGTLWPNWYDFHLESFIPLFMSMIYYYYLKGSRFKLISSMILLLTTFERSAFILIFFIMYIFLREFYIRSKNEAASQPLDLALLNYLLIMFVISAVYMVLSESIMFSYWPERYLLQPAKIFGTFSYENVLKKISYITFLSAPLFFLSFDSPLELVPSLPYLFLAFMTDYSPYFTITWQYPALISIPFFVSAIFGFANRKVERSDLKLITPMVLFFILFSPASLPMSRFSENWALCYPTTETHLKHQALADIEADASVLAQENIFPNIAERELAYTLWPNHLAPPDYIVFDVLEYWFYNEPGENSTQQSLLHFLNKYEYGVFSNVNGFLILKKGYNGSKRTLIPLHFSLGVNKVSKRYISFEDSFPETLFFVPPWVKVEKDSLLIERQIRGSVWWGPYVTVPPGNYSVEIHVEVEKETEEPLFDIVVYWFNKTTYVKKTIFGSEITPEKKSVIKIKLELDEWVPALEVVGISHGNQNLRVYKVNFEEIT